jgi:hypothetical protein
MHDRANGLRRNPIPRGSVNRDAGKGQKLLEVGAEPSLTLR